MKVIAYENLTPYQGRSQSDCEQHVQEIIKFWIFTNYHASEPEDREEVPLVLQHARFEDQDEYLHAVKKIFQIAGLTLQDSVEVVVEKYHDCKELVATSTDSSAEVTQAAFMVPFPLGTGQF